MITRAMLVLSVVFAQPFAQGPSTSNGPWTAPSTADVLKDPMASNPKAVEKGAKVFTSLCWTCHGMHGFGDGPNASVLRKRPTDLGTPVVQAQSNGALYWKVTQGRGEMASYELVLSREDRWAVVHYLRTLAHE